MTIYDREASGSYVVNYKYTDRGWKGAKAGWQNDGTTLSFTWIDEEKLELWVGLVMLK